MRSVSSSKSLRSDKTVREVVEEEEEEVTDVLPEVLRTSLYIHETNKDLQVLIKMPCIEYSFETKSFTFVKTLTRSELQEYIDSGFH